MDHLNLFTNTPLMSLLL